VSIEYGLNGKFKCPSYPYLNVPVPVLQLNLNRYADIKILISQYTYLVRMQELGYPGIRINCVIVRFNLS